MNQEPMEHDDDFSPDEMIIRKKKETEMRKGVTAQTVLQTAADALDTLRAKRPLVHCITNKVAAGFTANALLALGATPAMIDDVGEVTQFIAGADGLLVNTGTIDKAQADAMRGAVSHANMKAKPWLLDPVGVGALPLRTFTAKELIRRFPAMIRGNASAIGFLASNEATARGMDSTKSSDEVAPMAQRLAGVTRAAVLLTGATDYVAAEGAPLTAVANGSPMMGRIASTGCVQGAIGAAFLAALGSKARWEAALATALTMAIAGEKAAEKTKAPGSYAVALLDALDALKPGDILKSGRVEVKQA